jgi:hypothetical protein
MGFIYVKRVRFMKELHAILNRCLGVYLWGTDCYGCRLDVYAGTMVDDPADNTGIHSLTSAYVHLTNLATV